MEWCPLEFQWCPPECPAPFGAEETECRSPGATSARGSTSTSRGQPRVAAAARVWPNASPPPPSTRRGARRARTRDRDVRGAVPAPPLGVAGAQPPGRAAALPPGRAGKVASAAPCGTTPVVVRDSGTLFLAAIDET